MSHIDVFRFSSAATGRFLVTVGLLRPIMARKNAKKMFNGRRPRRQARAATRGNATRVLATGVGAAVPRAFGGVDGASLQCWDAKHKSHLALPRAVGPYTTIRATRRASVTTVANVLGTYQADSTTLGTTSPGEWSTCVMVTDVAAGDPINGTTNANRIGIPLNGLGDAATLVPSAFSVQIMCPTALQSASGIVYAGVMDTQAAIGGRTESWISYMDKFVQFQNPRLLAASKLALRGVQINSYPLNMSEVSRFTPLRKIGEGPFIYTSGNLEPTGWAPIMIYNPNQVQLELLITVEYRVRFDLDHPASASHTHHPVASDATWDRMVKRAVALGNGVVDIADVVANAGVAVGRAAAVLAG